MNRSIVLITAAAALGLTACTSAPAPGNTTPASPTVVTEVVTQTVTNPPAPPAKPVIDSFGYGRLKLGMTRQQALDAKLLGPDLPGPKPAGNCTIHEIIGTGQKAYVSKRVGVSSIWFTSDMTTDGVGMGAAEASFKAKYPNLKPREGKPNTYETGAEGNAAARFQLAVFDGKVGNALLMLEDQDCHN